MSEPINDGGPAFPETRWDDKSRQEVQWLGMTLRDYFAAKSLSAVIQQCANDTMNGMTKADYFAGRAYELADAMIKARSA